MDTQATTAPHGYIHRKDDYLKRSVRHALCSTLLESHGRLAIAPAGWRQSGEVLGHTAQAGGRHGHAERD